MAVLRGYYPMAVSDPELWAVSVAVCEKELNGKFPDDVVLRAFDLAWREHRDFFPTVGQLEEICVRENMAKKKRDESAERNRQKVAQELEEAEFKRKHPEKWAAMEEERRKNFDEFFAKVKKGLGKS